MTEKKKEVDAVEPTTEALQNRIKELEAKLAAGEEAALKRVCKALDVDPASLRDPAPEQEEVMISCHVPFAVNVNGMKYVGKCVVKKSTFHVIQQAIGDRYMRRLRELTGTDYVLKELGTGSFVPHVVGKVDQTGERV